VLKLGVKAAARRVAGRLFSAPYVYAPFLTTSFVFVSFNACGRASQPIMSFAFSTLHLRDESSLLCLRPLLLFLFLAMPVVPQRCHLTRCTV